ncbi:MAG: pre-toxin TG domain-containing protein [Bacteriovoracaceae bacterium]|nr:pre-toxin TG domain-containing protein [Bacteriovoracaceae bacterium]
MKFKSILPLLVFLNISSALTQVFNLEVRVNQSGYGYDFNPMAPAEQAQRRQRLEQAREAERRRIQEEQERKMLEQMQYLQALAAQQGQAIAETERIKLENQQRIADAQRQQNLADKFYKFQSADSNNPRSIKNWSNLRNTREMQIATQDWLNHQPANLEYKNLRQKMINLSDFLVEVADQHYLNSDQADGDSVLEHAREILDTVVDFLPGASLVKDAISILQGKNPITGEQVSNLEKAFLAGGLFAPAVASGAVKSIQRAGGLLKKVMASSPLRAKIAKEFVKVIEEGDKFAKRILKEKHPNLGGASQEASDAVEAIRRGGATFRSAENLAGRAKDIKYYDPLERGQLSDLDIPNTERTVADTFRSGSYTGYVNSEPLELYRVSSSEKDFEGAYWSFTKPEGPGQAMVDSALDPSFNNNATNWVKIIVPPGNKIYEGIAAPIYKEGQLISNLLGGGSQVYLNRKEIKILESWIPKVGGYGKF